MFTQQLSLEATLGQGDIQGVQSSIGQQNSAELALVQAKGSRVPVAHPHTKIPKVPPPWGGGGENKGLLGCSVSQAHKTSLGSILFRICGASKTRRSAAGQARDSLVAYNLYFFKKISTDLTNRFNISSSSSSSTFYQWNPCSAWTAQGHPCEDAAVSRTLPSRCA